jgi:hypothetical protein
LRCICLTPPPPAPGALEAAARSFMFACDGAQLQVQEDAAAAEGAAVGAEEQQQ